MIEEVNVLLKKRNELNKQLKDVEADLKQIRDNCEHVWSEVEEVPEYDSYYARFREEPTRIVYKRKCVDCGREESTSHLRRISLHSGIPDFDKGWVSESRRR